MTDEPHAPADEVPHDLRLKLPTPWVTLVLIALNVAAFAYSASQGAGWVVPDPEGLVAAGGNLPALTLNGEPWRLLTAMFLHGGLIHLAMNMICLWPGGRQAEYLFGRKNFLAIYLIAGLLGGIVSAARTTMIVSVGASGAVFGVFGAIFAYLLAHRDQLEPTVRSKQLKSMGSFMGLNLILGITAAGIDMAAHVGGFVAGFLIAYVAERRLDLTDQERAKARRFPRVILASVVALGVVGVGLVALPGPKLAYVTASQSRSVEELDRRFKRFATNEEDLLAKLKTLLDRRQSGEITDREIARAIDEELLSRWRALAVDLAEVEDLPPIVQPRQQAIVAYIHARVAHLEALSALFKLDTSTPEYAKAERTVEQRSAEITASLEKLKLALQ